MRRLCGSALACCIYVIAAAIPATAEALPPRFDDTAAFSGLTRPIAVDFAADGRVFVAEQSGLIKVFDGFGDTTATQVADLGPRVQTFWDRGLLSLAVDPQFPSRPYIYVTYTYDAPIGGTPPTWGDSCPTPPGPTADGCVVSGRLSRLTIQGNTMTSETVLINDWCQQYASHSVGDIAFGANGSLYMSGGDGASFSSIDYGQYGSPRNPCGDPPTGVGGTQTIPSAEGGALRSQDYRTSGDPLGLDGTLIRVNPDTGRPIPDIPGANQSTLNQGRVVAYGLRNPFRIAVRPGTNEIWVGDVGWNEIDEINRVTPGTVGNFGWPCYEGTDRPYDIGLSLCDSLYSGGGHTPPVFDYRHGENVVADEPCKVNAGSSISGLEFYETGSGSASFPSSYDGTLFFADYPRSCIWSMGVGQDGLPDPSEVELFEDVVGPVDLELGPDDALYYVSLDAGQIRRIGYEPENRTPIARATATPDHGLAPLTVQLDARTSSDPDPGDTLTFAWDLDGDGAFDDSTSPNPSKTYTVEGEYRPRVKVTDPGGASSQDDVLVDVGSPPVPSIDAPNLGTTFHANEEFQFRGSATDSADGTIPSSRLHWEAVLNHCTSPAPEDCHQHAVETFDGVATGETAMPAHERPYYLTLTLTARDSDGLQASVSRDFYPKPNVPPVARATATPDHGTTPLQVQLDASASSDANPGDQLSYDWDLDGDGEFDDSGSVSPTRTYEEEGTYHPRVLVRDQDGAFSDAEVTVFADEPGGPNAPPSPRIDLPSAVSSYSAGERIAFAGGAGDLEDGNLPGPALSWRLVGVDCPPDDCFDRALGNGALGELVAPEGPMPKSLRLELTATDSAGESATTSVDLEPRVAKLTVRSKYRGARVSIARHKGRTPFAMTVLKDAAVRLATPARQSARGFGSRSKLEWRRWSDKGERVHSVSLDGDRVFRAAYRVHPKPADGAPRGPRGGILAGGLVARRRPGRRRARGRARSPRRR